MEAHHFFFSNNIAHPSSNKPSINITANIFLLLNPSENYLKYALGYQESVDEKFVNLITDDWGKLLRQQPIHKQFLNPLNIAEEGQTTISTLAKGCRFTVRYENSVRSQLVAETFLQQ